MPYISVSRAHPLADLLPTSLSERSWALFWSILDGFWMDFEWILMDFGIIFQGFWSRFCSSICRMPTPPGTKRNNGKRQEHADNCRNMQKSNATKNALIKTPIDNLQAAKCGFQPSLKTTWFSVLPFLLQYFDCLPTKLDTWCRHSIWKMISASRRIFWDGFQRVLKTCRLLASVFSIASHLFSNQNKLWNMLQAAFDHEESFFNTPKGWNASFRWVFDVITFKIQHFSQKMKISSKNHFARCYHM